jgi:mono/diheme cytochrome c family protein
MRCVRRRSLPACVCGSEDYVMKHTIKVAVTTAVAICLTAAAGAGLFAVSGLYNFAADEPHFPWVSATLETMRERSIETRAAKVAVPDLSEPGRLVQGAGNYAAMCASCHLAPGVEGSELSRGLYPQPPNLSKDKVDAAQTFWVIKHGFKASGMPAWGKSMDDESIWNLVAFLQKLPQMDDQQYDQAVGNSGGHSHAGGHETGGQDAEHGTEGHVMEGPMHSEEAQTAIQTHTRANGMVHTHTPAPSMRQGRPASAGAPASHP